MKISISLFGKLNAFVSNNANIENHLNKQFIPSDIFSSNEHQ